MSRTILYIEDDPDNLMLVKRAIEAIGYEWVGANSGLEGLRIAEEIQPDLILLDIHLPDIDGYEVTRRIRASAEPKLCHVPILVITANALQGDDKKAIEAGCDVYLSKPLDIRELWIRVGELLAHH